MLAFNLLTIGDTPLAGPSHYAVQLFEAIGDILDDGGAELELVGYVQRGGEDHFSERAKRRLRLLPKLRTRGKRVLFEQLILPFRLLADKVDILLNPAFTGPVWGAQKVVTVVHDLYFKVVPEMVDEPQRRFLSVLVPFCCRRSWKILTVSEHSARDIVRYYPDLKGKVVAIPLGSKFALPPAAATDVSLAKHDPYVLMVANLTANKNPAVVVEALARYRVLYESLQLVHVGFDPLWLLKSAVAAHNAETWVRSERNITDGRLASLYAGAVALVIPSFYEGFGLPVLEGQSLRVPVICSNVSALPEVAGEGALYFDPNNPEELLAHIRSLTEEEDLRQRMIAKGQVNAARFSWRRTGDQTLRHLGLVGKSLTASRQVVA